MMKGFLTGLLFVGIFAVGFLIIRQSGPVDAPQSAQALAAVVTPSPERTLTPSPVPSPTIDLPMTAQVLSNAASDKIAQANRDMAAAELVKVDAANTQISAVATVQAANLAVLQLTATLAEQNKQVAVLNMTIQAGNILQAKANTEYLDAQTNQLKVKATWTAEAPAREAQSIIAMSDAKNAELQGAIKPIGQVVILLAVLAFLVLCVFLTIRHNQDVRLTILREENPAPFEVQPKNTIPATWIKKENTAKLIEPPPCTNEQWAAWCEWMLNGGSGSIATWTYKGSPFVGSDYRYNMHEWAIKYQVMAVIDGEQKLTEKGIEYCEAHKPPSPAQESPSNQTPLPTRA